jgi:hypothetical protein
VSIGSTLGVSGTFTASGTTTLGDVTTLQNTLRPNATGTIDIGQTANRFATVYANNLNGTLTGNVVARSITVGNILIGTDTITVNGNDYASQTFVNTTINGAGKNSQGTKIISTSPPSGSGSNGDIWYQV